MNWKEYVTLDGHKMVYRGIDIGISREFISDLNALCLFRSDDMIYKEFERIYNSKLSVIRNKKIDDILT